MGLATPLNTVTDPGLPGGCQTQESGVNLLFGQSFRKTTWKWRKLDRKERGKGVRVQNLPTYIRHWNSRYFKTQSAFI